MKIFLNDDIDTLPGFKMTCTCGKSIEVSRRVCSHIVEKTVQLFDEDNSTKLFESGETIIKPASYPERIYLQIYSKLFRQRGRTINHQNIGKM